MVININENIRVTAEPMNIIVQRRRFNKKKNIDVWENVSYHPTYKQALHSLVDAEVRGSYRTIKNLVKRMDELHKEIDKLNIPER